MLMPVQLMDLESDGLMQDAELIVRQYFCP